MFAMFLVTLHKAYCEVKLNITLLINLVASSWLWCTYFSSWVIDKTLRTSQQQSTNGDRLHLKLLSKIKVKRINYTPHFRPQVTTHNVRSTSGLGNRWADGIQIWCSVYVSEVNGSGITQFQHPRPILTKTLSLVNVTTSVPKTRFNSR